MQANDSLSLLPVATVFFLSLLAQTSLNAASDLEREQRLAEQIVDTISWTGNWFGWLQASTAFHTAAEYSPARGATDYKQPMKEPFPFHRLQVPFLNVYGGNDYPAVQRLVKDIETVQPDLHPVSQQIMVPGAEHYFDDYNTELTETITGWLESLARPTRQ